MIKKINACSAHTKSNCVTLKPKQKNKMQPDIITAPDFKLSYLALNNKKFVNSANIRYSQF